MERVYAWFDPWAYASDEGWQTVQSLMAIGSGGLSGVGLGSGGSKWCYLPERHTDFIFSDLLRGNRLSWWSVYAAVNCLYYLARYSRCR